MGVWARHCWFSFLHRPLEPFEWQAMLQQHSLQSHSKVDGTFAHMCEPHHARTA